MYLIQSNSENNRNIVPNNSFGICMFTAERTKTTRGSKLSNTNQNISLNFDLMFELDFYSVAKIMNNYIELYICKIHPCPWQMKLYAIYLLDSAQITLHLPFPMHSFLWPGSPSEYLCPFPLRLVQKFPCGSQLWYFDYSVKTICEEIKTLEDSASQNSAGPWYFEEIDEIRWHYPVFSVSFSLPIDTEGNSRAQ